jgi:hypothetical protein
LYDFSLNPKPLTLNPKPYTLHPTPYTLHPKPESLDPKLYTLAHFVGRPIQLLLAVRPESEPKFEAIQVYVWKVEVEKFGV